jgi:diacylglycerol kinase (ATP)
MVSDMIKKILNSIKYSCNGFKATFACDFSFRLEIFALPFLAVLLVFLPVTIFRKILMFATYLIIPSLELLNSAIEKLADRVTTEHDVMIGFAKDAASAAVMLSFILVIIIWIGCLWF